MSTIEKKKNAGRKRITPAQVIRLVQPIVDANQPKKFQVVIKGARFSEAWKAWMVFLDTDRDGADALDFVRCITDIHELAEIAGRKQNIPLYVTGAGNPEV